MEQEIKIGKEERGDRKWRRELKKSLIDDAIFFKIELFKSFLIFYQLYCQMNEMKFIQFKIYSKRSN